MISIYFNLADSTESVDNYFKYPNAESISNFFKLPQYNGAGSYIYPIWLTAKTVTKGVMYDISGKPINNSLTDTYCITIPNFILDDVQKGKCKIVLDIMSEPFDVTHSNPKVRVLEFVRTIANTYNLTKDQILICTGNLTPYKNIDCATVCSLGYLACLTPKKDLYDTHIKYIKNKTLRGKKILTLMHFPRIHRLEMGELLYKKNLLRDNLVSLYYVEDEPDTRFDIDYLNSLPWIIDITPLHQKRFKFLLNTDTELNMYLQTYVNFVVESFVDNSSAYNSMYEKDLTEKTFKPITQMQPFVLYAQHSSLKLIKSYGYQTFDRWWDESYDDETDRKKRLNKIITIFEKINSMTHKQLADMLFEMLPILEHNRKHHQHLLDTGFYYKDFHDTLNQLFMNSNSF